MDYIFASGQRHHDSRLLRVISYDICCQWSKYLTDRVEKLPKHLKFNFDPNHLKFVIPKLHLYSHKVACHVAYSFNLLPGGAQTDGEAVERSHSKTNPAAPSTVQCGPGLRWDILNDLWGFQNYMNTINMGRRLEYTYCCCFC
jgi:Kyakuja-Dileera-Zisupton transposase